MALKEALIGELKHETSLTKKILERVPWDKKDWRPHEKSMTLGRLSTHICETINWMSIIYKIDDFDFTKDFPFKKSTAESHEELMQLFQSYLDTAIADLSAMNDEDFNKMWTVRRAGEVMLTAPKKVAIRGWGFSHHIHHRGQLSVFLRLLDIPVPGMYGPSADERMPA